MNMQTARAGPEHLSLWPGRREHRYARLQAGLERLEDLRAEMIARIDELESDVDLEDGADAEPYQGDEEPSLCGVSAEHRPSADRWGEYIDLEDGAGDDEPSLTQAATWAGEDQRNRAGFFRRTGWDDREGDHDEREPDEDPEPDVDGEPSLAWPEGAQFGDERRVGGQEELEHDAGDDREGDEHQEGDAAEDREPDCDAEPEDGL